MTPIDMSLSAAPSSLPLMSGDGGASLASVLDSLDVAICIFDDEDKAVSWNEAFLRFFPEHRGEVHVGEHYADNLRRFYERRLAPDERAFIDDHIACGVERHRAQTRPFVFEHRGRWLRVAVHALPGLGRARIWTFIGDAESGDGTPHDLRRDARPVVLPSSEALPDGVITLNAAGRITTANREFARIYGLTSPDRALDLSYEGVVALAYELQGHPQERIAWDQHGLAKLREAARFAGAPFVVGLPGGRWVRVLEQRQPDGSRTSTHFDVTLITREQTRLQEAEAAARRSEARHKAIIEHAPGGMAVVDRTGTILEANRAFSRALRNGNTSLVGVKLASVMPARDAGALSEQLTASIRSEAPVTAAWQLRRGDGSWMLADASIVRLHAPGKAADAFIVQIDDRTEQRAAEAALRDSEALLRLALDAGQMYAWERDLTSDRIVRQGNVAAVLGYDPDETATAYYGGVHPDDREKVRIAVQDTMENGAPYQMECRFIRPDGREIWLMDFARRFDDGSRSRFVGVCFDITRRRAAEEALARKTALHEVTLDTMDQGLLMIDAQGQVVVHNRRALELFDVPETLLDENPSYKTLRHHLFSSGKWGRAVESGPSVWQVGSDRRSHDVRSERQLPSGRVVEVRSMPTDDDGVVQTFTDITRRKRYEAAVRESEERYRLLAETTSDVIAQVSLPTFERTYISPSCRKMFGREPAEMLGRWPDTSHVHPDDVAPLRERAERLARADAAHDQVTYRVRHKQGHWLWVDASFNLVRDAQGAPTALVCSLRDVTERQRQQEELRAARAAAEAGARVKAEFLANMSHELRTPLAGMLGVHDLLHSDPVLTERQRRFVDLAQEAGRSLLNIVNDILDFSKIEAGQMTVERIPFRVRELIEACRQLGAETIKDPDLRVTAEVQADVPPLLLGDPTRLRQVVLNLVTNAIKFTGTGSVVIRASWTADAALRVEVADTGIGIPAAALPTLFERFSQADGSMARRFGGTGLGLAICKRLIGLMRGEIGAISEEGQGSTFWFELPLAPAEESLAAHRSGLLSLAASLPRHMLVAEDNAINQTIIRTVLEAKGHTITLVGDGAAAVEAFKADRFDIVLMDVQMPGLDGLAATAEIRRFEAGKPGPATPIVALTANAMAEEVERCKAAGMDAHVAKPIDWNELFRTVDNLCGAPAVKGSPNLRPTAAPVVFNEASLDGLAALLGPEQITSLLTSFCRETERRIGLIEAVHATPVELGRQAHALVALAGQLGFSELSALCAELEEAAGRGAGLDRRGDLRTASDRAIEAARRSSYLKAA